MGANTMKPATRLLLPAILIVLSCAPSRPAAARIIGRSAEISIGRETASAVEKYYRFWTTEPHLIPGHISHGCIRLRNAAILALGRLMPVGTPVTIQ